MPKKRQWSDEERGKVVALRAEGKTWKEIQDVTGLPPSTAHAIVQKASTTVSVVNLQRSGRPSIFTPTVEKHLHAVIRRQPDITAKELANKLVHKFGAAFARSESSVRKKRVLLGYSKTKGIGVDTLTDAHKKQRVRYCNKHKRDKFRYVIFSDEKTWLLGKRRRPFWRRGGTARITYWKTKYPIRIQCWGGISFQGKTRLRIWAGRQPSSHYMDTLERYLFPFASTHMGKNWRFQQDRDTTHMSKATQTWLREKKIKWFETPAKSPDLAPIEKVWNILEMRVYRHQPKTVEGLKRWILYEWKHLEQKIIDSAIESMMKNIPLIIEAKGEYVESKRGYRV
jgi:transposase